MKYGTSLDGRVAERMHIDICSRCCANCKWFDRSYEDSGCDNPKILELRKEVARDGEYISDLLGAYGGIVVHEGNVCDYHELDQEKVEENDLIW